MDSDDETSATIRPSSLMSSNSRQEAEPDMVAVYTLIGSLCVSGLVILLIIVYCTVHCWRKKCRNRAVSRGGAAAATSATMMPSTPPLMTGAGRRPSNHRKHTPHIRIWNVNNLLPLNGTKRPNSDCSSLDSGGGGRPAANNLVIENCRTNNNNSPVSPKSMDRLMIESDDEKRSMLHYDLQYCDRNGIGSLCGLLTFALRYDHIHRVLMVHLIRAGGLMYEGRDTLSTYVKLHLLPDRRYNHKTNIRKNSDNPEFNEMFSFDVPYNLLSSRMLQFTIYNFERLKRHDIVGNVIMRDLFEKSDLHLWTEYTMQIIADTEKDDYGDILFYTLYNRKEEKFFITVSKAYNLRPMDITGASDPYVKMIQVCNNKRVKVKKSTRKMANLHPVYNETFVFELENVALQSTNFLIKVMDWDRFSTDDLLGSCVIGPQSPTREGREQWRLTLTAADQNPTTPPDKPVGMWHSLLAEIPENFSNLLKR